MCRCGQAERPKESPACKVKEIRVPHFRGSPSPFGETPPLLPPRSAKLRNRRNHRFFVLQGEFTTRMGLYLVRPPDEDKLKKRTGFEQVSESSGSPLFQNRSLAEGFVRHVLAHAAEAAQAESNRRGQKSRPKAGPLG